MRKGWKGKNSDDQTELGLLGQAFSLYPGFHNGSIIDGSNVRSQLKACRQLSGLQMSTNKSKWLLVLRQGVFFLVGQIR